MSNLKRNHYCGTLAKADNEKEVVLCGWVAKRRDHGGLIFIDLRDRSGIVQVVVDPDHAGEDFAKAEAIRSEYVIKVVTCLRLNNFASFGRWYICRLFLSSMCGGNSCSRFSFNQPWT